MSYETKPSTELLQVRSLETIVVIQLQRFVHSFILVLSFTLYLSVLGFILFLFVAIATWIIAAMLSIL